MAALPGMFGVTLKYSKFGRKAARTDMHAVLVLWRYTTRLRCESVDVQTLSVKMTAANRLRRWR